MSIDQLNLDVVIQEIQNNFPEFLRPKDLIKCGLFQSRSDFSWAKRRGQTPPSIKLSPHKTVYPRTSLCIWLREKAMKNELIKAI